MKFTETHEWVTESNDIVVIGISDHAQNELSDIVFVELPNVGDTFNKGDVMLSLESVKAASDIYAPVSGEVVEVNADLDQRPELVNSAPESDGWLVKMKMSNPADLEELLDKATYDKTIQG